MLSKGSALLYLPYTTIIKRPGKGWRNRDKTFFEDQAGMEVKGHYDKVNDSRPHWKRLKRLCGSLYKAGASYTVAYEFSKDRVIARLEWETKGGACA